MVNTSRPVLSIIIVNYNTRQLLVRCLSSIFEHTADLDLEIIVVDNNSQDESINEVRTRFPDVKVLANSVNKGFAVGNNQGLRIMKGKYALLLNSDTVMLDGTLRQMVEFMEEDSTVGITTCKILNADGSLQRAGFPEPCFLNSVLARVPWQQFSSAKIAQVYVRLLDFLHLDRFSIHCYDEVYRSSSSPFSVGWVTGACLMVKRKVVEQIGLLDEKFFLYCEDMDWCFRATKNNWRVMVYPAAQIIHYGGQSTSRNRDQAILASYQARSHFYPKHFGKASSWTLKSLLLVELWIKVVFSILDPQIDGQKRRSRLEGYRESLRAVLSPWHI